MQRSIYGPEIRPANIGLRTGVTDNTVSISTRLSGANSELIVTESTVDMSIQSEQELVSGVNQLHPLHLHGPTLPSSQEPNQLKVSLF